LRLFNGISVIALTLSFLVLYCIEILELISATDYNQLVELWRTNDRHAPLADARYWLSDTTETTLCVQTSQWWWPGRIIHFQMSSSSCGRHSRKTCSTTFFLLFLTQIALTMASSTLLSTPKFNLKGRRN
jgi:hypothetical protein